MKKVVQIDHPERLDTYVLRELGGLSRSLVSHLCKEGAVRLNGKVVTKPGTKIKSGDTVEADYNPLTSSDIPQIDLPILYQDSDCLVINKPAGLLTHSKGGFNPEATVATFIEPQIDDPGKERGGIVHRLDRITSGVIICAKTTEAYQWLQKQFAERQVQKTYVAIVEGNLKPEAALIDMPIERNPKKPQTFRVGAGGKPAETIYQTISQANGLSLVQLMPKTGRTHQLRVHMAHFGHPIVGDTLYGAAPSSRVFLHASQLAITLPNGATKVFKAKIPAEFDQQLSAQAKKTKTADL